MTRMSRPEFDAAMIRAGVTLDPATAADIHQAFGALEALIERVEAPLPREAEPGLIFVAAPRA